MDFDYDLILGELIQSARGHGRQVMNDGAVHYDGICIATGTQTLMLGVNIDTDEIVVTLAQEPLPEIDWSDIPELRKIVGQKLGWCWEARNSQGYWDCFMLALEDWVVPEYCFTGMASNIEIAKVSKITSD